MSFISGVSKETKNAILNEVHQCFSEDLEPVRIDRVNPDIIGETSERFDRFNVVLREVYEDGTKGNLVRLVVVRDREADMCFIDAVAEFEEDYDNCEVY